MSERSSGYVVFLAGTALGVVTAAASFTAARYLLSSSGPISPDKALQTPFVARGERGDEPDDDSSQRPGSARGRRHKKQHGNGHVRTSVGSHAQAMGHDSSGSPLPQVSRKAQRALYLDSAVGDDGTGHSLTMDSPKAHPSHLIKGQTGSVPSTPLSHHPLGGSKYSRAGGSHEDLTAVLASESTLMREGAGNTQWIAQRYANDHTLPSRANRGSLATVIPFNVAPVAEASTANTQRDVDTANGGGDDLEDAERALGMSGNANGASHLHLLCNRREKEREKESSPPPAGIAAPRQASMDSVEEYTEAEGDDEMADTELEDGAETDVEAMPRPHDAPSLVKQEGGRGRRQASGPSDRGNRWGAEMARMGKHMDAPAHVHKKSSAAADAPAREEELEETKPALSYARLEHNQQFQLNAEGLEVCELLQEALELRRRYVFRRNNEPADAGVGWPPMDEQLTPDDVFEWDDAGAESTPHTFEMRDGVMCVFDSPNRDNTVFSVPCSATDFFRDMHWILKVCASGPVKTMCHHRLLLLEQKFNLHVMLNADQEFLAQKTAPHRDFYNIRKVDTHVHHSASFNQKHLLRFIKSKLRKEPDEVVIYRDGKYLTLREVFESLRLTGYDLNVDTLDMHADSSTFHRFDKFNLKYNPCGQSRLREIFIKQDNLIHGRFLAELTKEVFGDLESQKYTLTEYRISVYGRKREEWDGLAAWIFNNRLHSEQNVWLIQIPRLFQIYKAQGTMNNFQEMLDNIFIPLFEVTQDPASHPNLHLFLKQVVGFDMVDDESRPERRPNKHMRTPKEWDNAHNPAYGYYAYYIWANLFVLNKFRESKGYSTFYFRPHAGEAGDIDHLVCAFLLANEIAHGNNLRKSPGLQYLFYLAQIGLAMSPLSNNSLFLDYHKNPFPNFFSRGLNVSLSTDDPLQIHLTKEPLVEEYSIAAQVWKLTACDLCEIARNSVLQSGYPHTAKQHWVSDTYWLRGPEGNDIKKTNVPGVRMQFRKDVLDGEIQIVHEGAKEWKMRSHSRPG